MFLRRKNKQTGFTLVELLVTISIFVILTGVVLFNQSKFNSTILLTNLAYDTALTIRQAQNYGINIKEFNKGDGSNSQFVPYGVHFDNTANKSFILFADIDYDILNRISDGIYDGNNESVDPQKCENNKGCVNRYSIKRGNYIDGLYINGDLNTKMNNLDITFKRPNPDAFIKSSSFNGEITSVTIVLKSADNTSTRQVRVQANGLIEILQ